MNRWSCDTARAAVLMLWIGLLLVACGQMRALSDQSPALSSQPATPSGPLRELPQARAIRIHDAWTGLAAIGMWQARYSIQRTDAAFQGQAEFEVARGFRGGGYSQESVQSVRSIEVPLDAAQTFLEQLARSPLDQAPRPQPSPHTDDYPEIRIEIDLDSTTIVLSSDSQDPDRSPWRVEAEGRTLFINTDQPVTALVQLQPYFQSEVLQELRATATSDEP